ncbi:MAG: sigma-70 family RNA polymerase sigma factor [Dokdonella sp.]
MSASNFQIEIPETVLARARRGDNAAFETIYRAFERPAYTLALRMSGDRDDACEIVHDAMLRVLQRIAQFRGESPFWGWVRQIVANEALMRMRRNGGRVFESIDAESVELHSNDLRVEPPSTSIWPDARGLDHALNALPSLTRSVLWLYHVEGYTHPEIAEMTGKTVSFSKSQVARGTARLRTLLDPLKEAASCLMTTPP